MNEKKQGMSKLLLNQYPLVILPELAIEIGLNEAIILQQIHYWLSKSKHIYDGRSWIYNTYEQWGEQFPFWSIPTIKRTITSLETKGLVITGNYNKLKIDRTKWYSIDYDKLEEDEGESTQENEGMIRPSDQNDPMQEINLIRPLPETTPETTTIKKGKSKNSDYLSAIVGKANGDKEPDKYIKDQFFGYRDDYLKIVQATMGERRIGEVEKDTIVELSNAPNADPAIWEASCKAAILNWTGNGWPSWDRIIEIYEMGRGDYKVFSQKKWGEPEQGKVDGDPFDQFVNLNEELK